MALNNLNNLYREVILDHGHHPRHNRKLANPTHQMELLNPTCGDAITVQIQVDNNQITDIAFTGHGCTISTASASMMTETLINQTIDQAQTLIQTFNTLITTGEISPPEADDLLQDTALLAGLKQFPSRYKCGILAWKAVELGLSPTESQTNTL
ncbi:Fe-S cluster assembly sulfur transfer protein SufU [Fundicoccus ignavus]|uniref:SUF system NifU family Fe-S cluster assembly protein n=1 Tax=Fundicoccus ignavus TaxID=2664442 RepID=A0A844C8T6_9LACT|nr:SUF system NifU family Fe-S cluster assembly protein [Fundicoccus ignavus]MRJ46877.1 SUF system NifU family Fe-S cluster assembly protein [Fundicoccus ignavus]